MVVLVFFWKEVPTEIGSGKRTRTTGPMRVLRSQSRDNSSLVDTHNNPSTPSLAVHRSEYAPDLAYGIYGIAESVYICMCVRIGIRFGAGTCQIYTDSPLQHCTKRNASRETYHWIVPVASGVRVSVFVYA